jgi:hypothetical protein
MMFTAGSVEPRVQVSLLAVVERGSETGVPHVDDVATTMLPESVTPTSVAAETLLETAQALTTLGANGPVLGAE